MITRIRGGCLAMALLSLVGCGSNGDAGDQAPANASPLKVMTRNLFLGGELEAIVLSKSVEEIPGKVASFWQAVRDSDAPGRLQLVANEIAAAKPDIVGLQEVEMFRVQSPSDFFATGRGVNAAKIEYDFLALLLAALEAQGAHYKVAAVSELSDNEMPCAGAAPDDAVFDLRMTDRDAILVRTDLAFANPRNKTFDNRLAAVIPDEKGLPITIVRGYQTIDVDLAGARLTFANSHLEVGGLLATFQEAQANELVTNLGNVPGNLVVAGDFNSAADGTGTRSYGYLTKKLRDSYAKLFPGAAGLTCCTDVAGSTFTTRTRIDLVLTRGSVFPQAAEIVGISPLAKTPLGRFASDHAGLVVSLAIGP